MIRWYMVIPWIFQNEALVYTMHLSFPQTECKSDLRYSGLMFLSIYPSEFVSFLTFSLLFLCFTPQIKCSPHLSKTLVYLPFHQPPTVHAKTDQAFLRSARSSLWRKRRLVATTSAALEAVDLGQKSITDCDQDWNLNSPEKSVMV